MARYYLCVMCKKSRHDEDFSIHGEGEEVGMGVCDDCVVDACDYKSLTPKERKEI